MFYFTLHPVFQVGLAEVDSSMKELVFSLETKLASLEKEKKQLSKYQYRQRRNYGECRGEGGPLTYSDTYKTLEQEDDCQIQGYELKQPNEHETIVPCGHFTQ